MVQPANTVVGHQAKEQEISEEDTPAPQKEREDCCLPGSE
jgi:hypothetical protein